MVGVEPDRIEDTIDRVEDAILRGDAAAARAAAAALPNGAEAARAAAAGLLCEMEGDRDGLRRHLAAARGLAPDHPRLLCLAAVEAVTRGALAEADAAARAAVATDDGPRSWETLGAARLAAGRWAEAADALAEADRRAPGRVSVALLRARALGLEGRTAEQIDVLAGAVAAAPEDDAPLEALVQALANDAGAALNAANGEPPTDAEAVAAAVGLAARLRGELAGLTGRAAALLDRACERLAR